MPHRNHESLDIRIGESMTLIPLISSCHTPKISDEQVNMLQGRVDLKFRITGSDGMFEGLYFSHWEPLTGQALVPSTLLRFGLNKRARGG